MVASTTTPEDRIRKADQTAAVAQNLASLANDWSAVCYFYAAYHTARAAITSDPIFDKINDLQSIHKDLIPDDKYVSRHQGRAGKKPREFGINDLIGLFYPSIRAFYTRLHSVSIDVRYGTGIGVISAQAAMRDYAAVRNAYDKGLLIAKAKSSSSH